MPTLEGAPIVPIAHGTSGGGAERRRARGGGGRRATFAGAVWAPEHSALVYGPERLEHLPDILICLLLP